MLTLDLLKTSLEDRALPGVDASHESFDKVVGFIEKEQMNQALEIIKSSLSQGCLDIRLIFYYVYAHFLENGITTLQETLPFIITLSEEHFEKLSPVNKKETHFQNSLNWFFSKLLNKLKYSERMAKTGKKHPFLEELLSKMGKNEFDKFLDKAVCFQHFFYEKWPSSSTKEKVAHLVKRIEELRPMLVIEAAENPVEVFQEEEKVPGQDNKQEVVSEKAKPQKSREPEEALSFNSEKMNLLIKKMELFEILVERKDYFKAALVGKDISYLMENFDPCSYFPKLFSQYFASMAKNISEISEEWGGQDLPKWDFLNKLYKTDMERFLQW